MRVKKKDLISLGAVLGSLCLVKIAFDQVNAAPQCPKLTQAKRKQGDSDSEFISSGQGGSSRSVSEISPVSADPSIKDPLEDEESDCIFADCQE